MSFSERLKKLRKEKCLTQEELAKAIFVSRTLISKYENGSVYPTKENAEKLSLFFNVDLSELIDGNDTVQLVLKNSDLTNKINNVISSIIVFISSVFVFLSFIPCVRICYYDYFNGTPPTLHSTILTPIQLTLNNNNPIAIITLITLLIDLTLGFFTFKFQKNIWIKLCAYVLFVINLFLIFFSIVFVVMYSSNNLFDHV